MTGYQAVTATFNVAQANGTYTSNLALFPTAGAAGSGRVEGTVKDADGNAPLGGAVVILSHGGGRGGVTVLDTSVTKADGSFIFPTVPAAQNYTVTAQAAGYAAGGDNNVDVANRDTVIVPFLLSKLPKPSGAVVGHVSDAATKAVISGAMVILRMRGGPNAAWEDTDTTTTGADGFYEFRDLSPSVLGAPYSVLVSKSDYATLASGNIAVANNRADTVNVALAKIVKGSLSIFVGLDSATHPRLAGANVAATLTGPDGQVFLGATDSTGWLTFPRLCAGSYSIAVTLDGYVSKTVARNLPGNAVDTLTVYLTRATAQNSKALSGIVRDAVGKAISGAKVTFQANGASGIKLSATSSATGDYAFIGIPNAVNGGTLIVAMDGFQEFTSPVTLSIEATNLNVTLQALASTSIAAQNAGSLHLMRTGSKVVLEFPAAPQAGSVSWYDLRGTRMASNAIPAGARHAELSLSVRQPDAGLLVLRQGASVQRIRLPAAR